MKKLLYIFLPIAALLCLSCTKVEYVDPFQSGVNIAHTMVGAGSGTLSVLVNTKGTWRVSCDQPWVEFDVKGGVDKGAFTIRYASNESDISVRRQLRKAKIVIGLDSKMVSDTITVVQQGFISGEQPGNTTADPDITVEFDQVALKQLTIFCCSMEGVEESQKDAALQWAKAQADICVAGKNVYGKSKDINVAGCDFAGLDQAAEYQAFKDLVDSTLNAGIGTNGKWVICGQTYHLSMMQTAYPTTPSWYPDDARNPLFDADRFAWQNNLYDMLWMKQQNYISTYSDIAGHSYQADYMYVSSTLLSNVSEVELVSPSFGMAHKAIKLTLKY